MLQNSYLDRIMDAGDHFKNGASLKRHMSKGHNRISLKTTKLLILFILSVLFFSSCDKNDMDSNAVIQDYTVQNVIYSKNSKLKHVSYVESVKSKKGGIIISQYEYDEHGKISKVSCPMYEDGTSTFENGTIVGLFYYSDYIYNIDGQLEKIKYYHSNLVEGFINLETRTYTYDKNGNKIKEEIDYPRAAPHRTDYTLFSYDNNRLKQEDKYEEGYHGSLIWCSKLTSYIKYEYDNKGNIVKETYYLPTDDTPYRYSVHSYQNGLNVKTEVFVYYNVIGKTQLREINRYYDKNDNLIYLESNELTGLSSSLSYVAMYEYY